MAISRTNRSVNMLECFLDPLHVKERTIVPDFVAGKSLDLYFYETFV